MYFTALRDTIRGIDADLVPLGSCSQPVFKWSSLLLFHFPGSARVPEIMNCSNSNFNLGLEAWSFVTPKFIQQLAASCWASSPSSCSPGTSPASPVSTPILVTFFPLLNCYFSGKKLNCFIERSGERVASPGAVGLPLVTRAALRCLSEPTWSILANAESCCQQQPCHPPPQAARPPRVPLLPPAEMISERVSNK